MCEYCISEHCVLVDSEASVIILTVNEDGKCMAESSNDCDFYVEDK